MRPVRADHRVFLLQVRADADGHRLLPGGEMHLAGHRPRADVESEPLLDLRGKLALEVDGCHRLLVVADLDHLLVHPRQRFVAVSHVRLLVRMGRTGSNDAPFARSSR
jgi:hypothetical protein